MRMKNSINIDEKLYEKIIAVAYKDASSIDKFIVYRKAKKDPEIQQLLNEFTETAMAVHNIKSDELPDSTIASVKNRMNNIDKKDFIGNFVYSKIIARPLLSSGIAGILILALAAVLFFRQPQQTPQYTKVEIELAQKQLEESVAIVNKVFKNAEKQLDKEVIPNIINNKTNKGFNLINDLLIGG